MEAEIYFRAQELQEANRQLRKVNEALQKEIAERKRAEEEIRKLNATLERRVAELTTALNDLEASKQVVLQLWERAIGGC
jgi:cell division septum initiation protein DivIVA